MSKVLGIDLGTTNSAAAYQDEDGKLQVIRNLAGEELTPSVVVFPKEGGVIVGSAAKNALVAHEGRGMIEVKRVVGEQTPDGRSLVCLLVDGKEYTPEAISSFIIKYVVAGAESHLETKITEVVIAVPAYFKNAARMATKVSAELAGVKVHLLVNEPTAAALAYGLMRKGDKTILVFDFGGGTHDVSIIRTASDRVDVLATRGNRDLGGSDLDGLLMEYVLAAFEAEHGFRPDPVQDTAAMQDLKDRVERARIALSSHQKTLIAFSARGKQVTVEITRAQLEEMIAPFVEQTMDITDQALKDAGLAMGDVTDIVMVGGTTRTPMVRRRFKERFGREPVTAGVQPDLAVAMGAALMAGAVDITEGTYGIEGKLSRVVHEITPHPLGVGSVDPKTGEETITVMIPRGSPIPFEEERLFLVSHDLATKVRIKLCVGEEGTSTGSKDCEVVGEMFLDKLPRKLPREPRIRVMFRYTKEGIVEATATDIISGNSTNGRIEGRAGMSDEEKKKAQEDIEGTLMV